MRQWLTISLIATRLKKRSRTSTRPSKAFNGSSASNLRREVELASQLFFVESGLFFDLHKKRALRHEHSLQLFSAQAGGRKALFLCCERACSLGDAAL